jgi:type II secretory pathway pseudopilin PulG
MMKNTKGITLVALVITIIIMLILAGISIQAITQTNLFGKTEQAKGEMDNAQKKENETLSSYTDRINEYLPDTLSYKVSNGEIEIGSYVNYVPDEVTENDEKYKELISNLATYSGNTDEDYNTAEKIKQEKNVKWRVLDVKDGQVRLISAEPTNGEKMNDGYIQLENYDGYNNAVKLIDDTCSTLYNNAKIASKVQNLKIEDIEEKMKEKDYSKFNEHYGKTFTYTTKNRYYPNILLKEKEQEVTIGKTTIKGTELGPSEQNEYIKQEKANEEADTLKVKSTYWYKTMEQEDFDNSKYYELFINNGKKNYDYYWLSSRCVYAGSGYANFDVYYVDSGGVSSNDLYYSDGGDDSDCNACRPVITLNSNIQIDTTNPGDGTENNAYNIK